jgi:hypothetical protein
MNTAKYPIMVQVTICACKGLCCLVFKNVSESLNQMRLKMGFGADNIAFNSEFILVKGVSVPIENCEVIICFQS